MAASNNKVLLNRGNQTSKNQTSDIKYQTFAVNYKKIQV